MDKKNIPTYVGVFLVAWVVLFLLNYMYLKKTVVWEEDELVDSTLVEEEDGLRLTWDISGESLPPDEKLTQLEEQHIRQQEETRALVDSVVKQETVPLQEEMEKTKQELEAAKEDVNELEDILTALSTQADSLDMVKAKRLSKILEGMKPQKAASILSRLHSSVNAEILMKMRQKQAAKILSELPQSRAAEIARFLSEAYTRSTI
ncbi:MAG: hypothetical protein P9L92_10145 [Candidatus Electryonea clarkiae]|nr:hypothetical protein [Candidatus Electryonea clarkiae]MDP8287302.1 hypothetical protein [Candidatus Electryonea clarkiae]